MLPRVRVDRRLISPASTKSARPIVGGRRKTRLRGHRRDKARGFRHDARSTTEAHEFHAYSVRPISAPSKPSSEYVEEFTIGEDDFVPDD